MNYIITTTEGESLQHHGIIGQRWGIRRYQNPDGSLTAEGARRYNKNIGEDGSFRASNGVKVGAPKTAYQKFARSVLSPIGSAAAPLDMKLNSQQRKRILDEQNALREYKAAKKDDNKGTGTKYLDKAAKKTKLSETKYDIASSRTFLEKFIYQDGTWKAAARKVINQNMTVDEALKGAKTEAWFNTGAVLAILGAVELYKLH